MKKRMGTIFLVALVVVTFVLVVAPVAFGQYYNPRDWEVPGNGGYGYGGYYGRGHGYGRGTDWSRVAVEAIRVAGGILEQPRYVQPMYAPAMDPGQQYQQPQYPQQYQQQYPQQYPPQPVANQVPLHLGIYGYGQRRPFPASQPASVTVVNHNVVVVNQAPQTPAPVAQATLPVPATPTSISTSAPAVPAAAPVAQATPPVPAAVAPATVPAATVVSPAEPSYLLMFGIMIGGFLLMMVILAIAVGLAYLIFSRRRSQQERVTPVVAVAPSGPVKSKVKPTPEKASTPASAPVPAPAPAGGGPAM